MNDQQAGNSGSALQNKDPFYACVEKGIWTPIPKAPPQSDLRLKFRKIDLDKSEHAKATNRLTFHAVGCSGCYEQYPNGPQPGPLLAKVMGAQAATPRVHNGYPLAEPASFLYRDIVYKQDTEKDPTIAPDPSGKEQSGMYNTQFSQRGDPNLGPTPRRNPGAGLLQPLAVTLQHAFQQAWLYPDLVISAHAHLYQRITYTYTGGHQIPYLIAGSGGHWPVERLAEACDKSVKNDPTTPLSAVSPRGVVLPPGDSAQVESFNDADFGYLRITVNLANAVIAGEFFTIDVKPDPSPRLFDSFILDLRSHKLR